MLVTHEKPSRHLASMLFGLWTLHNKLNEETKAFSILSSTNTSQAEFLMKTLLLAVMKPMIADRRWALQNWETLEKAALHPPAPREWTKLCPCELFCFVLCSVFGAGSSEVSTPLKNFFPLPQLVLFNSVVTESSFHNTFPSRLEEFSSVKRKKETKKQTNKTFLILQPLDPIGLDCCTFPIPWSRFLKGEILFSSASSVLSPGPFTSEQQSVMINLLAAPQAKHLWTALEVKLCLPPKTYQRPNPLYLWPYLEVRSLPEKRHRETQEGQVAVEEEIRVKRPQAQDTHSCWQSPEAERQEIDPATKPSGLW